MGVTEIAFLPLQDGKNLDDQTSAAGKVHIEALNTVLAQPGVQRAYWGRQVEDRQLLIWFVDWEDIEDHKRFMNSDAYKPFLGNFGAILGGAGKAYHARLIPHPPIAALSGTSSPTTEIVIMWFPTSYSQEDQDILVESMKVFVSAFEKEAKGFRASARGWVEEEIDIPETYEKGKAYMLLLGWTSVQAHNEFRDTSAFKDNIHYIMGAKDLKKIEAVHSNLKEVTAVIN